MEGYVYKASLMNSYAAADIVTDTSQTPNIFRIPGLFSIKDGDLVSIKSEASVAERVQVWTLGEATPPTIVAGEKYQLKIGNTGLQRESWNTSLTPYGYTAPTILVSAAEDRNNAYVALASRINASQTAFMTAYPMVSIAHAAGNFIVGSTLTGATSGATGIVIANTTTTLVVVAMTGTLSLRYVNGENLSDGTNTHAATAGPTVGYGLRLVDATGYYLNGRKGANTVVTTKGFTSANMVLTQSAQYSFGIGSRMLLEVPIKEVTTDNLSQGSWENYFQNAPVSTNTYTRVTIVDRPKVQDGAISQNFGMQERVQVLWLNEGDADLAATITALNNLL